MQKTDKRMQLILCLVILAGCLYVFHTYLFGNDLFVFTDDGSDTKEQYLMQYNTIVNHLRAGDFSFWDFNYGLGTNLFMLNLTDPFLMLLYGAGVLFGPEHLPFYLVYYHIVKVLAAGWVCYRFLSCFPFMERVKGLCALIYAFSGYMMVWGQHYQFSTPLILYPLILWMIEKALKHARWGLGLSVIVRRIRLFQPVSVLHDAAGIRNLCMHAHPLDRGKRLEGGALPPPSDSGVYASRRGAWLCDSAALCGGDLRRHQPGGV